MASQRISQPEVKFEAKLGNVSDPSAGVVPAGWMVRGQRCIKLHAKLSLDEAGGDLGGFLQRIPQPEAKFEAESGNVPGPSAGVAPGGGGFTGKKMHQRASLEWS